MININKKKNIKISFRDSYQILIGSLAKSFHVEDKGLFPYDFVNVNNLNYIGEVPDIKYFNNISENEYNEYKNNPRFNLYQWSLKDETINYCLRDCKVLYKILVRF